jgi:hypothetical protein
MNDSEHQAGRQERAPVCGSRFIRTWPTPTATIQSPENQRDYGVRPFAEHKQRSTRNK